MAYSQSNQLGSWWQDLLNIGAKIATTAASPSTVPGGTPPMFPPRTAYYTAPPEPSTVAGLSITTLALLGFGAYLLFSGSKRKRAA